MSSKASRYPVSKVISKVIRNSGYTPLGFLLATGYSDAESVLPSLESWLQNGEGDEAIIATAAAYDPEEAAALYKAVEETVAMKAASIDPVAHEQARIEKEKRDRFRPFIHAEGEQRTFPITFFARAGWYERGANIHIPDAILELPLEEQLAKLPELMAKFRGQYKGLGKLLGFKFVRYRDYFQFDPGGRLIEHVEEIFRREAHWVELR